MPVFHKTEKAASIMRQLFFVVSLTEISSYKRQNVFSLQMNQTFAFDPLFSFFIITKQHH
ncbi:hypothetical protein CRN76_09475 [Chryseobacterium indologenes]|nr:hypothetical protein CRN76_09475 [Chryseobacterium indologenes]AYY85627.1 hypothetical protein EGX91_14260 [Chryseobacterium indologenes]